MGSRSLKGLKGLTGLKASKGLNHFKWAQGVKKGLQGLTGGTLI